METRLRTLTLAAVLVSAVVSAPVAQAQPDRGAYVRVDASDCRTTPRRASGFVSNSTVNVVTALHVVAGCSTIKVYYSVQGGNCGQRESTAYCRRPIWRC